MKFDGFYIYMETISDENGKRTVQQAIDYITDDHDSKRLGNITDQMIAYICRIDSGYKTEHEGGKVPLVGHGLLTDITDLRELTWQFNEATIPANPRGKKGYKSVTLTLPKELTLVCETNKLKAREAITKAIDAMLPKSYPGKDLCAVSAMHTRNEAGDPHVNVHLLIAKTVRDQKTGKMHSINNLDWYEDNSTTDAERMKAAWKEEIIKELEKEFKIEVSFDNKNKCKVVTYDGLPLKPLTAPTASQRQRGWIMANVPQVEDEDGKMKPFNINILHAKILEVAKVAPLTKENFCAVFPEYEKKWVIGGIIETLQKIGYLDRNLKPSKLFEEHAKWKFGTRPEWGQIKEDVDNILGKLVDRTKEENPSALPEIIEQIFTNPLKLAIENSPEIAKRVDRLKPTPIILDKIEAKWVDLRKQITPELKTWVDKLHRQKDFMLYVKKEIEESDPRSKDTILEYSRAQREKLKNESDDAYRKAARSLQHPLLKGHRIMVSNLAEDRKLLKSIQRKIESLETERDNALYMAGDHQKPFIEKYYEVQLKELARTSIALRKEVNEKQARALRNESGMPTNSQKLTKTTTKPGQFAIPPDLAARMYQQIFHGRSTMEDYLGEKSPLLGQHLTWLRRGYNVMQILGYREADTLRMFMIGGLDKHLLKDHKQRKISKDVAMATIKAQGIGSILAKAEFNYSNQKPNIPPMLRGTESEDKVKLLIARLEALGIGCPDLSKFRSAEFKYICEKDERLNRLTSHGSAYIMDWQYKNNTLYEIAVGKLVSRQIEQPATATGGPGKTQTQTTSQQHK